MKCFIRSISGEKLVPAKLVPTERGTEVRGRHLHGIVNSQGQLVIKLRDEILVVEEGETETES